MTVSFKNVEYLLKICKIYADTYVCVCTHPPCPGSVQQGAAPINSSHGNP